MQAVLIALEFAPLFELLLQLGLPKHRLERVGVVVANAQVYSQQPKQVHPQLARLHQTACRRLEHLQRAAGKRPIVAVSVAVLLVAEQSIG